MDWVLPLLLSPFIGSFLGVVIRRLPLDRSVALGRSACEGCGHALPARDLVPLVSYALLRGRCRYCRAGIGRFHVWIELAGIAVAAWATLTAADTAELWANCMLGWTLLTLAWIDADHLRLPDALTLPLLALGLVETLRRDGNLVADHLLAAAFGYLAFRGLVLAYRRLGERRSSGFRIGARTLARPNGLGRDGLGRDGSGQGGAKLLAAAGAWVGLAGLPSVALGAALAALAATLVQRLARRDLADAPVPFGPHLALATWLVQLYGAVPLLAGGGGL